MSSPSRTFGERSRSRMLQSSNNSSNHFDILLSPNNDPLRLGTTYNNNETVTAAAAASTGRQYSQSRPGSNHGITNYLASQPASGGGQRNNALKDLRFQLPSAVPDKILTAALNLANNDSFVACIHADSMWKDHGAALVAGYYAEHGVPAAGKKYEFDYSSGEVKVLDDPDFPANMIWHHRLCHGDPSAGYKYVFIRATNKVVSEKRKNPSPTVNSCAPVAVTTSPKTAENENDKFNTTKAKSVIANLKSPPESTVSAKKQKIGVVDEKKGNVLHAVSMEDDSGQSNDEPGPYVTLYRLLSADDLDNLEKYGAILPKDSGSNVTVVEHCNDGTLRSPFISLSLLPKFISFWGYKAIATGKIQEAHIATIRLPANDASMIDLSANSVISLKHRESHGVSLCSRASASTRVMQEVLHEGSISSTMILSIVSPDYSELQMKPQLNYGQFRRRFGSDAGMNSDAVGSSSISKDEIMARIVASQEANDCNPLDLCRIMPICNQQQMMDAINNILPVGEELEFPDLKHRISVRHGSQTMSALLVGRDVVISLRKSSPLFVKMRKDRPRGFQKTCGKSYLSLNLHFGTVQLRDVCINKLDSFWSHFIECEENWNCTFEYVYERARLSLSGLEEVQTLLNQPIDAVDWFRRCVHQIRLKTNTQFDPQGHLYLPCLCGRNDCQRKVEYLQIEQLRSPHLIHEQCALDLMNIRECPKIHLDVFDHELLGLVSVRKQSEIGDLMFDRAGRPTQFARIVPFLIGTELISQLIDNREEFLKVARKHSQMSYFRHGDAYAEKKRAKAAERNYLMTAEHLARTGVNELSPDNQRQMIRKLEDAIAMCIANEGFMPHMYVFDSRAGEDGIGHYNNEQIQWLIQASRKNPLVGPNMRTFGLGDIISFDEDDAESKIAVEVRFVKESSSGLMSRNIETFLIRYLKQNHPMYTINQKEIGPDTDVRAARSGVDNSKRKTAICFAKIEDKLAKGEVFFQIQREQDKLRLGKFYDEEKFV